MTEETSPIHDFYPKEFELDMNGKKQDWEAVVKIPFIDQARLLRAMARELSQRILTDNSPGRPLDRRRETKEPIWSLEHSVHL
jgi:5'-3' exonuclease